MILLQLPPVPECTDPSLNFCGGDEDYPKDKINDIFARNEDLKSASLTLAKFFRRGRNYQDDEEEENSILDQLACRAVKEKYQKGSIRARNINGKYKYLVQKGDEDIQEFEMVRCVKNDKSTCRISEFDVNHKDHESTVCKEITSTKQFMAIDEDGVISVDTFEFPTACVCRWLTV